MTVDATSVYWLSYATVFSGVVEKVPLGGGTPTTLVSGEFIGPDNGIAVDATSVYWTTLSGLRKVPLSGGTPTTLAGT